MIERDSVQFGNTVIEYTVLRSRRRKKTVGITLDHDEGVLVAVPDDATADRIRQVVLKRAGWIITQATQEVLRPHRKQFLSGESLPYLGRQVRLFVEHQNTRRTTVRFDHWSFRIAVPASMEDGKRRAAIEAAIIAWYKARAQDRLSQRTARWAEMAGWSPSQVIIRNQSQRWGSCSPDGILRFNWRIVMASPALIDYVVVHELVHLKIRTHSPLFWAEVSRLMPDYQLRRAALREIGARLTI